MNVASSSNLELEATQSSGTLEEPDALVARVTMQNRLSLLVDLSSLLLREVDLDALLATACERVAEALSAERATMWLVDAERGDLVARVALMPELTALRLPIGQGIAGWVAQTGNTVSIDDVVNDSRFDPSIDRVTGYTTRSVLAVPIREEGNGPLRGVLQVLNRRGDATSVAGWTEDDAKYLSALALQIGRAFALTTLRPADETEPGLTIRGPFNRIVGRSDELRAVYERVTLSATTDATVLFRGESGTGKGLFARAIHVNSGRQSGPFVTVDCTTLPMQLVESELFGHERGAFTGADRRVLGKIELAQGGTLFLDEIGDLPLESQGKLLRFVQERAFERVGGRQTLSADVRIVCATHRDLEALVRAGKFREDLYYRVRVVEIEIPPLRQRGPDEIEQLALHFADAFAKRYRRRLPVFAPDALRALRTHTWPGNVRELEHWVESAVVLAPDGMIREAHLPKARIESAPRSEAMPFSQPVVSARLRDADLGEIALPLGLALEEVERRYVEATLNACEGNKAEAARRLDIGRNTIGRMMKPDREG